MPGVVTPRLGRAPWGRRRALHPKTCLRQPEGAASPAAALGARAVRIPGRLVWPPAPSVEGVWGEL